MCTKLEPWSQVGPREQPPLMRSLDSYSLCAVEIYPVHSAMRQSMGIDFTVSFHSLKCIAIQAT